MNNYPEEWRKKDLNALINKLVRDVTNMGSKELRDEISELLPQIKKAVKDAWKEESR